MRDLTHDTVFHTAGDAVKRSVPDHVPYAEAWGVWARKPDRLLLLQTHWQPDLAGSIGFDDAVRRVIGALTTALD